ASMQEITFLFGTDCVPNTFMAFASACAFAYPFASNDPCNPPAGDANVLWDRSSLVIGNGLYFIRGTFDDAAPGPDSVAGYFGGEYTLAELPCDYMSDYMSGMD